MGKNFNNSYFLHTLNGISIVRNLIFKKNFIHNLISVW